MSESDTESWSDGGSESEPVTESGGWSSGDSSYTDGASGSGTTAQSGSTANAFAAAIFSQLSADGATWTAASGTQGGTNSGFDDTSYATSGTYSGSASGWWANSSSGTETMSLASAVASGMAAGAGGGLFGIARGVLSATSGTTLGPRQERQPDRPVGDHVPREHRVGLRHDGHRPEPDQLGDELEQRHEPVAVE